MMVSNGIPLFLLTKEEILEGKDYWSKTEDLKKCMEVYKQKDEGEKK